MPFRNSFPDCAIYTYFRKISIQHHQRIKTFVTIRHNVTSISAMNMKNERTQRIYRVAFLTTLLELDCTLHSKAYVAFKRRSLSMHSCLFVCVFVCVLTECRGFESEMCNMELVRSSMIRRVIFFFFYFIMYICRTLQRYVASM